jgi:intracellular sulfur oxidation DsrE/DsrF family protein
MLLRRTMLAGLAATVAAAGGGAAWSYVRPSHAGTPVDIATMAFAPYEAQKVVYHITASGGLRDRYYRGLLQVLRSHVAAVGDGWLDARVLLQGDGVGLLESARTNPDLARQVDELRRAGVRFIVCWNTLVTKGIDPHKEFYGVTKEDIVRSSVAELAALAGQGFAYLRL